ncbi:hypothetical protein [Jannaschia marina]|uniref:hypothetical protein n=1 Tax=Jannaschia marina TaxID=2741674 RepID=UPI0015CC98A3|nr:hypothetical protein [Jannaschia marina]
MRAHLPAPCAKRVGCTFAIAERPGTRTLDAADLPRHCALDPAPGTTGLDPLSYDIWRKRSLDDHETCLAAIFEGLGGWRDIAAWLRAKGFTDEGGIRIAHLPEEAASAAALSASRDSSGLPQITPSRRVVENGLHTGPIHINALLDAEGRFVDLVLTKNRRF